MAFIRANRKVISFASSDDVREVDSRIFEANEGLSDERVDGALIKATNRIIDDIQISDWWKSYYVRRLGVQGIAFGDNGVVVPRPNADLILGSQDTFSQLCVYFALSEYILPSVADFGNAESAERQKIAFYGEKASELFRYLIDRGDWYDFDQDGTVQLSEKMPTRTNLQRVR
jgi:hypothetical protein